MNLKPNYSYFPVFVDASEYGMTRDELYEKLKARQIFGRRYFYPLISTFSTYKGLESSAPENLPEATKVADSVICLPIYAGLTDDDVKRVIAAIELLNV